MALTEQFTLAIDAMGGDGAPDIVVEGMEIAAERHPAARFLLVGDETRLTAECTSLSSPKPARPPSSASGRLLSASIANCAQTSPTPI